MLTRHTLNDPLFLPAADLRREQTLWIDLLNPTSDELALLSRELGVRLDADAERLTMRFGAWIDPQDGWYYLAVPVLLTGDHGEPVRGGVLFLLGPEQLVTVRSVSVDLLNHARQAASVYPDILTSPVDLFLSLLDGVILQMSGAITRASAKIRQHSAHVFLEPRDRRKMRRKETQLRSILRDLGRIGTLAVEMNDNLRWLEHIPDFLLTEGEKSLLPAHIRRLQELQHLIQRLIESIGFIQQQIAILLDATLGIINLEENNVMRWLTVIATVFIPPTFIASMYGMNFAPIYKIGGEFAFPLAMLAMILSAVIPLIFFIRRGWL